MLMLISRALLVHGILIGEEINVPKNAKYWSAKRKTNFIAELVKQLVDLVLQSYFAPNMRDIVMNIIHQAVLHITLPPTAWRKMSTLNIGGKTMYISLVAARCSQ